MTADGTYPSPARVTTAAELDALPDGSVVRDRGGDAWQSTVQGWVSAMSSESPMDPGDLAGWSAPLTVLFRPDAPQPRAEDGCVDRDWHAEAHTRGDRLNALVAALHDAFAGRAHDGGFAAGIRGLLDENDRLRRDAPQPATDGDDAVERAARALNHHQPRPGDNGSWACLGCDVVAPTWAEFADHLAPTALVAARAAGGDDAVERALAEWERGVALLNGQPSARVRAAVAVLNAAASDLRAALAAARAGEADADAAAYDLLAERLNEARDERDRAEAALAAQRGGEAVDREDFGHPARGRGETYEPPTGAYRVIHRARNSLYLRATHEQRKETVRELIDALDAALAARGDGATPTEVEWGVRYDDGTVNGPTDRANAEYLTERDGQHFPLVQRTVSAWREVTDRG